MSKFCPFKFTGNYGYPACDCECMLYMYGKCAIAVMAENCLDDIDRTKFGAGNDGRGDG